MALDEVVEHLADGVAARLDLARSADLAAQRGGDPDEGHEAWTACCPSWAACAAPEQNST